jgi:CAAX protease family protein
VTPPRRLAIAAFYAALAAVALVWRWLAGLPLGAELWWHHGLAEVAVLSGLATAGVVLLATEWCLRRSGAVDFLEATFRELLGKLTIGGALWLAVLSAVGEELFFRGALQPTFGLLPASAVFGLLHTGPDRRFLVWTAFALAMGVVLGGLAQATGGVLAPTLAHFAVNFHNLLESDDARLPPSWLRDHWSTCSPPPGRLARDPGIC